MQALKRTDPIEWDPRKSGVHVRQGTMQAERSSPDEQTVDLQALTDLCTPWCLHVVATLDIAGHIAAGADHIDQLAAAAQCDSGVLHSILGHLAGKGVFLEPEPGRFALNDAARALLDPTL